MPSTPHIQMKAKASQARRAADAGGGQFVARQAVKVSDRVAWMDGTTIRLFPNTHKAIRYLDSTGYKRMQPDE